MRTASQSPMFFTLNAAGGTPPIGRTFASPSSTS
jgi:hypothetical protein